MSPGQSDNDDDLYCEPCPESPSKSVHDVPSTAQGAATKTNPPNTFQLRDTSSALPFRISEEWAAIDKNYTLYEAQQLDNNRAHLDTEISWREKEFERLAEMCVKGVTARFAGPMRLGHVSQLVDHPDLLLRYFQNERRIIRANQCFELRIRQMFPIRGRQLSNFYSKELMRRRVEFRSRRFDYKPVVQQLLTEISSRLYALVGAEVTDLTDDQPLTLLDDILLEEIINQNIGLFNEYRECWDLERQLASHRFEGAVKHTGKS
jgi:hypothetical protein